MSDRKRGGSALKRSNEGGWFAAGMLIGAPLAIAGGWIAYSNLLIDHQVPFPYAVKADRLTLDSSVGQLSYYMDRSAAGRPLVLIHSVNAAASAYEMKPLFEHYRGQRPVYALDLPGFGFSERTDRAQAPADFAQAIVDLIATIGEPVDAIGLSLGSEFVARAALLRPDLFQSIALMSPSGFNAAGTGRSTQQAVQQDRTTTVYQVVSQPWWGRALYDVIATRRSIEYFLQQSFVGPVPPELIEYAYATSHQPGAQFAPLRFISGLLFTRNARQELYEPLTLPVLVVYDRDAFVRFDTLPQVLATHDNWQSVRIEPTLGLPQFEALPRLTEALDQFWRSL